MRYRDRWTIGEWIFYSVEDHGFGESELFTFKVKGEDRVHSELYPSLEHAMVAAVGEKYTGTRGAGGSGVGTAADWFMKMIEAYR